MSPRAVRTNPGVVFRRLGTEMILMHLATNQIFELNETSARLWELLSENGDVESARSRLAAEYEVDGAQLSRDVDETLARFQSEKLVEEDSGV